MYGEKTTARITYILKSKNKDYVVHPNLIQCCKYVNYISKTERINVGRIIKLKIKLSLLKTI